MVSYLPRLKAAVHTTVALPSHYERAEATGNQHAINPMERFVRDAYDDGGVRSGQSCR